MDLDASAILRAEGFSYDVPSHSNIQPGGSLANSWASAEALIVHLYCYLHYG